VRGQLMVSENRVSDEQSGCREKPVCGQHGKAVPNDSGDLAHGRLAGKCVAGWLGQKSRSNTQHGGIFDMLLYGVCGNPLLYLDEVHKLSADRFDPIGPLYSLLKKDTANPFEDPSVRWLTLDASRILWICTVNDMSRIPEPIMSRIRVFKIPDLTREQALAVVTNITHSLRTDYPRAGYLQFHPDAIGALSRFAPRKMKQLAGDALDRAVAKGHRECSADDITAEQDARRGCLGLYWPSGKLIRLAQNYQSEKQMKFVLIVMTYLSGNAWGPVVSQQEYASQQSCEAARQQVLLMTGEMNRTNLAAGRSARQIISAQCVMH
jgi:hypothetical protein